MTTQNHAEDVHTALHQALDTLNDLLAEAEQCFARRNFSVNASVPIHERQLHFGRIGGRWRLYIEMPDGPQPLADSSMQYRMTAVDLLDSLMRACETLADERTIAVRKCCETVERWVAKEREK